MKENGQVGKIKILISFLGAGNYQKVKYHFHNKSYESHLSLIPLIDIYQPDKIYVIGTENSNWSLLRNLNYEQIKIPSGKNTEEFWTIFSLLAKKIKLTNAEIAFDITHSFRSIPFFVVIFTQFIKFLEKSAEISHIFYGHLDWLKEESTIIDLQPLTALLDWLEAISSLQKYGDLEGLCQLMKKTDQEIRKEHSFPVSSSFKKLWRTLETLNGIAQMTFVPQLGQLAHELAELIDDEKLNDEIEQYVKPLTLILPEFKKLIQRFKKENECETLLEIAGWYLENKNPTQALIVLRETIVTYEAAKRGFDIYDKNQRDTVERDLNEVRRTSSEPIHKLWNQVIDARNDVAHALMKKTGKNIDANRASRKVWRLLNKSQQILLKGAKHAGRN